MSTDALLGTDTLRVVVADDHPAVLAAVCAALEGRGMEVVARAQDGTAAQALVAAEQPDVAVLDFSMPGGSGLEVARSARRASPGTAVVLFTAFAEPAMIAEAFEAGVRGIVLKDAPLDDVVRAIQAVRDGGRYVDGRLAGAMTATEAVLTERELSVLRLLADGLRNEEIARRLFISAETVKVHVAKAMRKLGARTRTEAAVTAVRRGLIR